MVRRKLQPSLPKEYTARPKHAQKSKHPVINQRTVSHVRAEFDSPSLDRQITFSDFDDGFEAADAFEFEEALISRIDGETDVEADALALRDQQLQVLNAAMPKLTDRQALALGLHVHGASQHQGADSMGIAQPSFREAVIGKDGKGGAVKKLRKLVAKHPITHT